MQDCSEAGRWTLPCCKDEAVQGTLAGVQLEMVIDDCEKARPMAHADKTVTDVDVDDLISRWMSNLCSNPRVDHGNARVLLNGEDIPVSVLCGALVSDLRRELAPICKVKEDEVKLFFGDQALEDDDLVPNADVQCVCPFVTFGDSSFGDSSETDAESYGVRQSTQVALDALGFLNKEEVALLRGTRLWKILRKGAAIFASSSGEDGSYALSEPVRKIDFFISHNWSVSRRNKFLSLVLHFNLQFAFAVAFVTAILCTFLNAYEMLPLVHAPSDTTYENLSAKRGVSVSVLTAPVFFFALFFKHDILPFRSDYTCFLDKTCIHQTDPLLKKIGIAKLGAFLSSSSRMLVLYSPVYMKKLWTIYEVACFTAFHGAVSEDQLPGKGRGFHNIDVMHTSMSKYFYALVIIMYCQNCLWFTPAPRRLISNVAYVVGGVLWACLSRRADRTLDATWEHMRNFRVKNALCFDEKDRPVVENVIAALMVSQGYAREDMGREVALEAFDQLVKDLVTQTMKAALGKFPVPLKHIAAAVFVTDFAVSLDMFSGLVAKNGASDIVAWGLLLSWVTFSLGTVPFALQAASWLMSKNKKLQGVCEMIWILVCTLALMSLGNVLTEFNKYMLSYKVAEDSRYLIAYVPYNLAIIAVPCCLELFQHVKASKSICSDLEKRRASAMASSSLVAYSLRRKVLEHSVDIDSMYNKSVMDEESEVNVVVAERSDTEVL